MFLAAFPAGPWQANCYLVGPADGRDCLVIDAGVDAAEAVEQILSDHDRRLAGVLATHGHIDHVGEASALADRHQVPLHLHPADRHLLSNPGAGLDGDLGGLLDQLLRGRSMQEPQLLELIADGDQLDLAGLSLTVAHAPGHTAGSVLYRLPLQDHPAASEIVFSGDVVFAGSVGRTDLPGGDPAAMADSLARVVLALPDTAALLPGHGPQTLMSNERATNPFLTPRSLRN